MMRFIRNNAVFVLVVVIFIVAVFIGTIFLVWGRGSMSFSSSGRSIAAWVGETEIPYADFVKTYDSRLEFYRRFYPNVGAAELEKRFKIRKGDPNYGGFGRPKQEFAESYRAFTRACAKRGVGYFQWSASGTNRGAVARLTGDTEDNVNSVLGLVPGGGKYGPYVAISAPGDYYCCGMGYGRPDRPAQGGVGLIWNPLHPKVFDLLLEEARITRDEYGLQGVWIDSFQNFPMSHLAWSDGSGDSCQRKLWEVAAAMSRAGIALMAQGHAFPGLSCSIQVSEWEKDYWFFQHVWKWHRGLSQNAYSPEDLDDLCFRAASRLVQMTGRVMRAEDDMGETFILDDNVNFLVQRYRPFFPRWWRDAYRRSGSLPPAPDNLATSGA